MGDMWCFDEVLSLLEGGNAKFKEYCKKSQHQVQETNHRRRRSLYNGNDQNVYTSSYAKQYRGLIEKAVDKAQQERKALVNRNLQMQLQQQKLRAGRGARHRRNPRPGMRTKKYVKELPMLSLADFYTSVIGKKWPGPVENDEGERKEMEDGDFRKENSNNHNEEAKNELIKEDLKNNNIMEDVGEGERKEMEEDDLRKENSNNHEEQSRRESMKEELKSNNIIGSKSRTVEGAGEGEREEMEEDELRKENSNNHDEEAKNELMKEELENNNIIRSKYRKVELVGEGIGDVNIEVEEEESSDDDDDDDENLIYANNKLSRSMLPSKYRMTLVLPSIV